jgi:hypothetical protein
MANVEVVEEEEDVVVAAPVQQPGKLVLDIDVSKATIADMQAIDRMGSPIHGAFADAVDVLAKFVKNIDIRTRPRRELKVIAEAVLKQFKDEQGPN